MNFKVGVMTDSFRLPFEESLAKAAEVGADGVQVYAVRGDFTPEVLKGERLQRVKQLLKEYGLVASALCGDFGGCGFTDPKANPERIEASNRIVDLALELGSKVVTTHIGVIPEDSSSDRYKVMQEACQKLGEYAEAAGAYFAIETGPEPSARLKKFLDSLSTKGVAVNLDPANLVMVTGDDPVGAVHNLKDYIVHTHAKDGVMLKPCVPEDIYASFAGIGPEGLDANDYFREVPLGEGSVDFPAYLKALQEIGYSGFLTIEREVGDDPAKDIRAAVKFLRGQIG